MLLWRGSLLLLLLLVHPVDPDEYFGDRRQDSRSRRSGGDPPPASAFAAASVGKKNNHNNNRRSSSMYSGSCNQSKHSSRNAQQQQPPTYLQCGSLHIHQARCSPREHCCRPSSLKPSALTEKGCLQHCTALARSPRLKPVPCHALMLLVASTSPSTVCLSCLPRTMTSCWISWVKLLDELGETVAFCRRMPKIGAQESY